jgi:hypothetical protein
VLAVCDVVRLNQMAAAGQGCDVAVKSRAAVQVPASSVRLSRVGALVAESSERRPYGVASGTLCGGTAALRDGTAALTYLNTSS